MKHRFLITLSAAAAMILISSAGHAATDDGFGGSTYFTAQTPDALGDAPTGNAFAASSEDADADAVSKIEPAAGGDVFTLPEDPSVPAVKATGDKLDAPSKPIVPGQTAE